MANKFNLKNVLTLDSKMNFNDATDSVWWFLSEAMHETNAELEGDDEHTASERIKLFHDKVAGVGKIDGRLIAYRGGNHVAICINGGKRIAMFANLHDLI